MRKRNFLFIGFLLAIPFAAAAAIPFPPLVPRILDLSFIGLTLINIVWVVFITASTISFIYAGMLFLSGEPAKISQAKKLLLWGIVGVIVGLLSASIPFIIANQFGG